MKRIHGKPFPYRPRKRETVVNVYTNSFDPMALARAIEQAKRMLGSKPKGDG